jgi:hypothetical protein
MVGEGLLSFCSSTFRTRASAWRFQREVATHVVRSHGAQDVVHVVAADEVVEDGQLSTTWSTAASMRSCFESSDPLTSRRPNPAPLTTVR